MPKIVLRDYQEEAIKARTKKCGCVVCICEDDERCHGCGATSCDLYPDCKDDLFVGRWQPIETAPKDGHWIMLWRGPAEIGRHAPLVFGKWDCGYETFVFPVETVDLFHRRDEADQELLKDFYEDDSFTHWMHLPKPPELLK